MDVWDGDWRVVNTLSLALSVTSLHLPLHLWRREKRAAAAAAAATAFPTVT
eukprot:SAG25_NODE_8910_length_397_cov_0.872483_1_plen_50_part_01